MSPREPARDPLLAPEELARLRDAIHTIVLFAGELDRRDTSLVRLLTQVRTDGGFSATVATAQLAELGTDVARLTADLARVAEILAAKPLVSETFVLQCNEILRRLRDDVHDTPALAGNHLAVIVGELFGQVVGQLRADLTAELAELRAEVRALAAPAAHPAPLALVRPSESQAA